MVSRQRKYRFFHKLDGKCVQCPNDAAVKPNGKRFARCEKCLILQRERQRRPGMRRHLNAASYQICNVN